LQKVKNKATESKRLFTNSLVQMKTAIDAEAYWVANVTSKIGVELHVSLFDAETEATIWSVTGTECATEYLGRENCSITLNKLKQFHRNYKSF